MNMRGFLQSISLAGALVFCLSPAFVRSAETAKKFRISAVQESQVWIEGGWIDGLELGMEGDVGYEISVVGQKRRIIPAKVRLTTIEDSASIGVLSERSGIVNVGYTAQFIPKPASELLVLFNSRASASYAAREFRLSLQYYQRILEILPGDAYAAHRIKDCELQLEKQEALTRERRNFPYYRDAIRASLESGIPEDRTLAADYIEKILSIDPEDAETLKFKEKLAQLAARPAVPTVAAIPIPTKPTAPPDAEPAPESPAILQNMVLVPQGEYSIGSMPGRSPFQNELPRHPVHLESFYLDRHEVTNAEYKKFCDATGHAYPEYFTKNHFPPGTAQKPVVMVSWADANAYALWAGKRLPTEFEWEAAAAGGSGRTWPWGNRWASNMANTREKGEKKSVDVGANPYDVSEYGILDLAGNISEWTANWYQPYPGNGSAEAEYGERFKVLRGGSSWTSKEFTRAQFRARLPITYRSLDLGFRCALSAK
jgi:formylglycine-generating enzyme required for sulfatase activity